MVEKIVDWGFNVMHSDVDVVWFRDPLPYFLGAPCKDIDVAVSSGKCGSEGEAWAEIRVKRFIGAGIGLQVYSDH